MKILIICRSFFPVNSPRAFRANELVKEFVRQGHEVTVYCADTHTNREPFVSKYRFTLKEYHQDANKYEGKSNIFSRILFRLKNDLFEYPDISIMKNLPSAIENEKGYDLLISIAVPHPIHWAIGEMYEKGYRPAKTWVADCGDPYMLVESVNHKHPFYFKYLEKRWCKYCDYISVPTEKSKTGYYPEFHDKIRVIPQAFDFEEVKRQEYKKNPVPTFAFSGSMIPKRRDLRPILDVLIANKSDFRLHVFTQQKEWFSEYASVLKDKLILHPYLERLDLLYFLSAMDFLLNVENSGVANQTPSKLIDYGLTGRPILSLDSNHIDKEKLFCFLRADYTKQHVMPSLHNYDIKVVAEQFINLTK